MRKNIYLSERLDKDLIRYMEENNFDEDFSREVRNLMRDGLKYRNEGILNETMDKDVFQGALLKHKGVVDNTTYSKPTIDFTDIETQKKVVDLSELDARLNYL